MPVKFNEAFEFHDVKDIHDMNDPLAVDRFTTLIFINAARLVSHYSRDPVGLVEFLLKKGIDTGRLQKLYDVHNDLLITYTYQQSVIQGYPFVDDTVYELTKEALMSIFGYK